MHLRPYQETAVFMLSDGFKTFKSQILCMPTGTGKTATFANIAKKMNDNNKRVLILTDRTELLDQTSNTLNKYGIYPEIIVAGKNFINFKKNTYVAMTKTLLNKYKKNESFTHKMGVIDLVIVDECHKGDFRKILEIINKKFLLGCTATPISSQKKTPLSDLYSSIVIPITTQQAIIDNYLVRPRYFAKEQDLSDLELASNGDFSETSQEKHYKTSISIKSVLDAYNKYAKNRKTMVFCPNVATSLAIKAYFKENGISIDHIDGKTSASERDYLINKFKLLDKNVITNCSVLTTGFDDRAVSCIILYRATTSLSLYLQMVGRGGRPCDGKEDFIVIDFGNNITRHGFWEDNYDWNEIYAQKKQKTKEKVIATKECPNCESLLPVATTLCPFCSQELKSNVKTVEVYQTVTELTNKTQVNYDHLKGKYLADCSVDDLILLQNAKVYKHTFIWRICRKSGKEMLKEYATVQGYSQRWLTQQYEKLNDAEYTNYKIV